MSSDEKPLEKAKVLYAKVAIDRGLDQLLEYELPNAKADEAKVGSRVLVPLQGSLRKATIVSIASTPSFAKLRPIHSLLKDQSIDSSLYKLASWMSEYYATPLAKVLHLFIPSAVRNELGHKEVYKVSSELSRDSLLYEYEKLKKTKPAQAKVLEVVLKKENLTLLLSELLQETKGSKSPVDSLIKSSILHCEKTILDRSLLKAEYFPSKPKTLSIEQQGVFEKIASSISLAKYQSHLLFGVTGSGKTEIYLQLIQKARFFSKGALVLVPEVTLTTQMIEAFKSRFQEPIGVYHYRLSEGERHDLWHKLQSGAISIVLGARSAVFLPIQDLGIIIVDEEHESCFKQTEKAPTYNARDVAVMRGFMTQTTVVLGSATPSFESYQNALDGKYQLHVLRQRATQASMPQIHLIDMKKEYEKKNFLFSSQLLSAIDKRAKKGEQTILFLNRRGFYSQLLCQRCQESEKCPRCDVCLIYHKTSDLLSCHYCEFSKKPEKTCSSCQSFGHMLFRGYGTEQVEHQLQKIFPDLRILRMDADTTKKKLAQQEIYHGFRSGKADILIGTQMVSKGLHFPEVTLVGVLNADQSLHSPDFRACEHLFQLLVQVSGRAGRAELAGEVLIQTSLPSHPLFSFVKKIDYEGFFSSEILSRKAFSYPPFSRLAKVIFSGHDQNFVQNHAALFYKACQEIAKDDFSVFPAVEDSLAKLDNHFRFAVLIKGFSTSLISKKLLSILPCFFSKKDLHALIEIDH